MDQRNLLTNIVEFNDKSRPSQDQDLNQENPYALYKGREITLSNFRSGIIPIKITEGKGRPRMLPSHPLDLAKRLKILTPKQMLQRLPIALTQVKACNTSENLLNEMRQIIYPLYRAKEITKKSV